MKKIITLVLALSLIVFGSSMAASAAEINISTDNLGRGAGVATVVSNDDGSITSESSNISFYLPATVKAGETVTVSVKGSSDGNFRVWLIDTQEVTNSDVYVMADHGFTSGDFDQTFELTAVGDGTEIFFKGPSWDVTINNLTITELTVTGGSLDAAVEEDVVEVEDGEDVVEEEVVEEDVVVEEAPKTGASSNAVVYIALMGLAAVGYVATKKKTVNE